MKCTLHDHPHTARTRLRELGLTLEGLQSVVRAAVGAVNGCTSDHPPISRGLSAWMASVARLRQEFRPLGWEADDTANFSTIVDRASRIKVAVANTDEATASPHAHPTNRSKRGELSKQAIAANQFVLPFEGWMKEPDEARLPGYATWYLCLYIKAGQVRAELSLPTTCESGFFGNWSERIILISDELDMLAVPIANDDGPTFDVKISRK